MATLFFVITLGLVYAGSAGRVGPQPAGGLMSTVPVTAPGKGGDIPAPAAAPAQDAGKDAAKDAGAGSKPADIPK
jgi:hypothetical protein